MNSLESTTWIFILGWSIAAVAVGLICGFFIGKIYALSHESQTLKAEKAYTFQSLMMLIESANQLNQDVDDHNYALASVKSEIQAADAFLDGRLQNMLITGISKVMESNRKLEYDLALSRYKLESQAVELDKTRREARTDALCQVGNRKAVDEHLKFLLLGYRQRQKSFGLMLIDVDHFKRINDTFGHRAGDEVLTSISAVLKGCVRPGDFVGRMGGDEFCILLQGLDCQNATTVGKRIQESIEKHDFSIDDQGHSTVVTLSLGLTVVTPSDRAESIYVRADKALYRSKELGRNRLYTVFDDTQDQDAKPKTAETTPPITSYEALKAQYLQHEVN